MNLNNMETAPGKEAGDGACERKDALQLRPYCRIIRNLMKDRGYSMRCLARKSGISPATVSRILNGRQEAGVAQIEKIAAALEIPASRLLEEAGEDCAAGQTLLNPLFHQANITDMNDLEEKVLKEVRKYEEFALTSEGQELIHSRFEEKLNSVGASGVFIDELKRLYERLRGGGLSRQAYMMIGGALLYFILPMDIIPDYLFGMGYLDDLLVIQAVCRNLKL